MKGDIELEPTTSSVSVQRVQKKDQAPLVKKSEKLDEQVGNTLTKPVKGVEITFTLKKISAKKVDLSTMVWLENERDQELLDEFAISDILPTFKEYGQEVPAFGREECGVIQVADGSRRRFTAITAKSDFYVWVGELSDEQMNYLSEVGNNYRPTSAYEQGQKALRLLKSGKSQEEAAEIVGKGRRAMMREVNTAMLPKPFIKALPSPNDLSARQGETLFKAYKKLDEQQQDSLITFFENWCKEKGKYTAEDLVEFFIKKCGSSKPEPEKPRKLAMGATVALKNGNATINIPKVSDDSLKAIEDFISQTLSKEALDNC
ncbi:chromosome partitioning protein ParB [Vibrio zhanjiangensis]|uniref:Chromosome partitioning protein ParB n=1 Tax=Vibrio zhanjiangensis TaxID=1046128 RepID=A0ABQ6F490_9VIBR|nr:ParB/RepB/Spo0J family partition protein [Vibrio zhanjiangensis]GLT20335.1 chromosome partitioning protein ParB [Vibrio zhanjiangensis]